MNAIDLERIRTEAREDVASEKGASEAPWHVNRYDNDNGAINWQVQQEPEPYEVIANISDDSNPRARADAAFIARSRTALPARAADVLALCDEVERVAVERDEARGWVRRLTNVERVLTCAFCGEAYPPGTPESNDNALAAHVRICAQHPIREVEAEVRNVGIVRDAALAEMSRIGNEVELLRAALAAEREACARVADRAATAPTMADAREIAAAIRARSEKGEG